MIGQLRGRILDKQPPWLVLDVGGVGYELEASMNTFYALAQTPESEEIRLFTHMVVREDAQLLYGFASADEREMFRALVKVSGVGPKVGLAILSTLSAEEFGLCVQQEDAAALTRVPGIGKKTAERLIVEMRDRLPQAALNSSIDVGVVPAAEGGGVNNAVQDAVSALIALGYRPADASKAVRAQPDAEGQSSELLIRGALQVLSG